MHPSTGNLLPGALGHDHAALQGVAILQFGRIEDLATVVALLTFPTGILRASAIGAAILSPVRFSRKAISATTSVSVRCKGRISGSRRGVNAPMIVKRITSSGSIATRRACGRSQCVTQHRVCNASGWLGSVSPQSGRGRLAAGSRPCWQLTSGATSVKTPRNWQLLHRMKEGSGGRTTIQLASSFSPQSPALARDTWHTTWRCCATDDDQKTGHAPNEILAAVSGLLWTGSGAALTVA
jgi:hypothetical protein